MTYKTDKLNLRSQSISGVREWVYDDTGSTLATMTAPAFFADGKHKGMKLNDTVYLSVTGSGIVRRTVVDLVNAEDTGVPYAEVGDTG